MHVCLRDLVRLVGVLEKQRAAEAAREARLQQREREERIRALKSNDLAAYEKLLQQCKSTRLRTLLLQTDEWERRLRETVDSTRAAARLLEQQQGSIHLTARKQKALATACIEPGAATSTDSNMVEQSTSSSSSSQDLAARALSQADESVHKHCANALIARGLTDELRVVY